MTKKILVVDDELDFIELLRHRFPAPQYFVLFATNGTDALNQVWHHSPDVILIGCRRAGVSGQAVGF
jgi:CheY-like chemotaxis protein